MDFDEIIEMVRKTRGEEGVAQLLKGRDLEHKLRDEIMDVISKHVDGWDGDDKLLACAVCEAVSTAYAGALVSMIGATGADPAHAVMQAIKSVTGNMNTISAEMAISDNVESGAAMDLIKEAARRNGERE